MTPYTRPPVSTDSAIRPITRPQSTAIYGNLPFSAILCLPVSTIISTISTTPVTPAKFYQVCRILVSSARTATQILFCPTIRVNSRIFLPKPSYRCLPYHHAKPRDRRLRPCELSYYVISTQSYITITINRGCGGAFWSNRTWRLDFVYYSKISI